MNSITNCKEGVEMAAFRARMSTALKRQKAEGQQVIIKNPLTAKVTDIRNERIKKAIQNARYHLLDLFFLEFHPGEVQRIEDLFVELELNRLAEFAPKPPTGTGLLEPGLSKTS